ncbi:MAG: polysaccharide deacetylase family protein [Planctomycetota bacterium]
MTTSWDDGHPQDHRLADTLERHGVPATFYLPRTNPLDRLPVISEREIRALSDRGFEIGAHTLNHVVLTETDDRTARREIADSKAWVEDVTGRPCVSFSPPNGKHRAHHVDMIRDAGFLGYRSVEVWSVDAPRPRPRKDGWSTRKDRPPLLALPTSTLALPLPAANVLRNLIKRRAGKNLGLYLRHGLRGDWTDHAAALLGQAVKHHGVFHLWGHSWELEDQQQWDRLDRVLSRLAGEVPAAGRLTNGELVTA